MTTLLIDHADRPLDPRLAAHAVVALGSATCLAALLRGLAGRESEDDARA